MNAEIIAGVYGIKNDFDTIFPKQIHDHNIAVFQDGDLINYIHLERITRSKYDANLHLHIDAISEHLKLSEKKKLTLCFANHELGNDFYSDSAKVCFKAGNRRKEISILKKGRANWFGNEVAAYSISHELAHIYSCIPFFGYFRENSLMIHYDGGASLSNFSAWKYRNNRITNINYHWRLKQLTNLFNANPLVFRLTETKPKYHNSVPGKFMGLASHGEYDKDVEVWLNDNNFFEEIWSSPKQFFSRLQSDWGIKLQAMDNRNKFLQDIASTIHEIFVRESLKEIIELGRKLKSQYLYFTGGCALNIKLNSALADSGEFDEVFIPPCPDDSGLSLGAATAIALRNGDTLSPTDPYLNNFRLSKNSPLIKLEVIQKTAQLIYSNKTVGVCNGFGEIGPRALGNRSIIARADSKELAERISVTMKKREWYRPLAPVMLKEHAMYFTGRTKFSHSARYMLFDYIIKPDMVEEIEGVVHSDNTSRIQVLDSRDQNPFLYDLLTTCFELYGIRALINTSFNGQGEPIVHSPEDAIKSARKMRLNALVINGEIQML